ncbi:MAG: 4-hydroxybutyryl-CoA dehydratase/vinylacetyl-CoA-Delta-isomerase [Firmicutes bacterium]|nr:4-hydroxybutyryl-CoA dehydratase/vinylacetyl-CoA-Delta-isomerase [Bacillota bacterium]
MALKTAAEYIDSLRQMKFTAYVLGERVGNTVDHPLVRPSLNAVALTYELAHDPSYSALLRTTSSLTGETISRFCHLHQSPADLVAKVKMLRLLGQKTATCFQRCVGMDAINAVDSMTFEIDRTHDTVYHQRFRAWLRQMQEQDWTIDGAMTDPKGDRSKSPSQQADPDMYLRIVKEQADGIMVRGAKVHQTGALNSHEILAMPTIALSAHDRAYAVAFAVPADNPGLIYIYGRQASDTRKLEQGNLDVGNARFGGHECLVVFDDVFVPWERVFMCGEHDFAGVLVERFAAYHRQSYGGCKVGVGDVLIGAASLAAEYNGASRASHVKDKLIEMTHLNETLYACGLACSTEGHPTATGTYLVDLLLANVCKQNVTRFPYEISRLAEDIAGGLMVTMPAERDLSNPATKPWLDKYLQGVSTVPTEHRLRILRLIENLTIGAGAVGYRTESMHGAGSPQAQRIVIGRQADFAAKQELAKAIAGIKEGCEA